MLVNKLPLVKFLMGRNQSGFMHKLLYQQIFMLFQNSREYTATFNISRKFSIDYILRSKLLCSMSIQRILIFIAFILTLNVLNLSLVLGLKMECTKTTKHENLYLK